MSRLSSEAIDQIRADTALVERHLERLVQSNVRLVHQVGAHTLRAGGKRLRPAFLLLSAKATVRDFDLDRALRLGACLEMIHMATLIHDDVIDHAATRRGRPTAATVFGNTASILSGDVLLARAMAILAEDGCLPIIRTVSDAVVEMAEGEALEVETRGEFDLPLAEHLRILRMKTAAFVECCCKVGGLVAGASPEVVDALGRYGHHIGMAFQIVDDLLDWRGDEQKTGKPQATDFREGCATLPLIFLRERLSEDEISFARGKFGNGVTDDEIRMIGSWMDGRGAYSRAEEHAERHANDAEGALTILEDSIHREMLSGVVQFVLQRPL